MALLALGILIFSAFIEYFVWSGQFWNSSLFNWYPVITPDNLDAQYRLARKLLLMIRLCISCFGFLFCVIIFFRNNFSEGGLLAVNLTLTLLIALTMIGLIVSFALFAERL